MIKKFGGRFRTNVYAYVEFTTSEPTAEALKLDHTVLNSRAIYVSSCNADRQNKVFLLLFLFNFMLYLLKLY